MKTRKSLVKTSSHTVYPLYYLTIIQPFSCHNMYFLKVKMTHFFPVAVGKKKNRGKHQNPPIPLCIHAKSTCNPIFPTPRHTFTQTQKWIQGLCHLVLKEGRMLVKGTQIFSHISAFFLTLYIFSSVQ